MKKIKNTIKEIIPYTGWITAIILFLAGWVMTYYSILDAWVETFGR